MVELIVSKKVITRKPHNCWGCRKEYPVGSKLERNVSIDGGEIMIAYFCDDCQDYINNMDSLDAQDGFEYGQIADMKADVY